MRGWADDSKNIRQSQNNYKHRQVVIISIGVGGWADDSEKAKTIINRHEQ